MSTRPGSTFDAIAATSEGPPEPELPELGWGEGRDEPPKGCVLDTGLDPSCHRPWPRPTPAPINRMAMINRATAFGPEPPPLGSGDRGGAQLGFGPAQPDCHAPGTPTPGGGVAKRSAPGTGYAAVGGKEEPVGSIGQADEVGGWSPWGGGGWADGHSGVPPSLSS